MNLNLSWLIAQLDNIAELWLNRPTMKDYSKHEEYRVTYVDSWGLPRCYQALAPSYERALRLSRKYMNRRMGSFKAFIDGMKLRSVKVYRWDRSGSAFEQKRWIILKVFK